MERTEPSLGWIIEIIELRRSMGGTVSEEEVERTFKAWRDLASEAPGEEERHPTQPRANNTNRCSYSHEKEKRNA